MHLLDHLAAGSALLMDGAMGTELRSTGLRDDEPGEDWNVTHPKRVRAVHRAYRDAGAQVFLTNTFLAPRHPEAARLCRAVVALAPQEVGAGIVLGDLGPLEAPLPNDVLQAFAEADGLLLETLSDLRSVSYVKTSLPLLVSITFVRDERGVVRTYSGQSPADLALAVNVDPRIVALGVNCGRDIGLVELLQIVQAYRSRTSKPLFARPNAGTPSRLGDAWQYPIDPATFATWVRPLLGAGIKMIGGCCGTTPAHIAACAPIVADWNLNPRISMH